MHVVQQCIRHRADIFSGFVVASKSEEGLTMTRHYSSGLVKSKERGMQKQ
jgi:hypothetical protein